MLVCLFSSHPLNILHVFLILHILNVSQKKQGGHKIDSIIMSQNSVNNILIINHSNSIKRKTLNAPFHKASVLTHPNLPMEVTLFFVFATDDLSKIATVSTIFLLISFTELEYWINFTRNNYLNISVLNHKHCPFISDFPYGKHISFPAIC